MVAYCLNKFYKLNHVEVKERKRKSENITLFRDDNNLFVDLDKGGGGILQKIKIRGQVKLFVIGIF